MHYLQTLLSTANPDLNFWVSKLSKNSVLGVQMTRWARRWLSPCLDVLLFFLTSGHGWSWRGDLGDVDVLCFSDFRAWWILARWSRWRWCFVFFWLQGMVDPGEVISVTLMFCVFLTSGHGGSWRGDLGDVEEGVQWGGAEFTRSQRGREETDRKRYRNPIRERKWGTLLLLPWSQSPSFC